MINDDVRKIAADVPTVVRHGQLESVRALGQPGDVRPALVPANDVDAARAVDGLPGVRDDPVVVRAFAGVQDGPRLWQTDGDVAAGVGHRRLIRRGLHENVHFRRAALARAVGHLLRYLL